MSNANRYDRQELIDGWQQERLGSAKAVVAGSGGLAEYVAMAASALGFGDIELYGNWEWNDYSDGFLHFEAAQEQSTVEAAAEMCKKFNPLVDVAGVRLELCRAENLAVLGSPDVIFEATNEPASKLAVLEYAQEKKIPVVSLSAGMNIGKLGFYNPKKRGEQRNYLDNLLFAELQHQRQGNIPSAVIAAIGVDEARKWLMPIRNEAMLDDIIVYNLHSNNRFDNCMDRQLEGNARLGSKRVAMIGAGGLGNPAGLELVLSGVGELVIFDDDTVEETNLNRQPWFYDAVGRSKAEALAGKFRKINPNVKCRAIKRRIMPKTESYFRRGRFDLIIDTVDNNKTRALLNYFSSKYRIPLISGGTRYDSGQVVAACPGVTACLNCKVDIDQMALDSHRPQSCILAAQPSVITSNLAIGAMIAGEARTILCPEVYGPPMHSVLKYISGETLRVGLLPAQKQQCSCHEEREMLGSWMEKMKHLYGR